MVLQENETASVTGHVMGEGRAVPFLSRDVDPTRVTTHVTLSNPTVQNLPDHDLSLL